MKIKSIVLLAIVLGMAACIGKEKISIVSTIVGSYEGYVLANSDYFKDKCSVDEIVMVSENADGTATITFVSDSWGKIVIPKAIVASDGGVFTLSGDGEAEMTMNGNNSLSACSFTAVIDSKKVAQMQFVIPTVMGGLTICFSTGDAPLSILLSGTYKGYSETKCTYFNQYADDESVTLSANDDGTLAVAYTSESWGAFTVASAAVTHKNGRYVFEGSGVVAMGMGETKTDYPFTLEGVTNSAKDDFTITFVVPAVMGGLTITILPGTAPQTNE